MLLVSKIVESLQRYRKWGVGGVGSDGGELKFGEGRGEFGRRGLLGEIFPSQGNELIFG